MKKIKKDKMIKNELRKSMTAMRDSLTQADIDRHSSAVFHQLLTIPYFCECDTMLCYISIKSEVSTKNIIEYCNQTHKKTAAPRVNGNTMDFFYFKDFSDLSDDNRFHIPEPVTADKCIPDFGTVIIIPGLIFDETGARIGYGGGYYDKYLAKYDNAIKIAVAYDFQVMEHINNDLLEDTDIRPDYIVTDKRILQFV